jgi:hypothetical protein
MRTRMRARAAFRRCSTTHRCCRPCVAARDASNDPSILLHLLLHLSYSSASFLRNPRPPARHHNTFAPGHILYDSRAAPLSNPDTYSALLFAACCAFRRLFAPPHHLFCISTCAAPT